MNEDSVSSNIVLELDSGFIDELDHFVFKVAMTSWEFGTTDHRVNLDSVLINPANNQVSGFYEVDIPKNYSLFSFVPAPNWNVTMLVSFFAVAHFSIPKNDINLNSNKSKSFHNYALELSKNAKLIPSLIFKNESHNRLNVVYKRKDGNIGWIDPLNMK